jgi:hypothetical protein
LLLQLFTQLITWLQQVVVAERKVVAVLADY